MPCLAPQFARQDWSARPAGRGSVLLLRLLGVSRMRSGCPKLSRVCCATRAASMRLGEDAAMMAALVNGQLEVEVSEVRFDDATASHFTLCSVTRSPMASCWFRSMPPFGALEVTKRDVWRLTSEGCGTSRPVRKALNAEIEADMQDCGLNSSRQHERG